jgi:hypothetical protein
VVPCGPNLAGRPALAAAAGQPWSYTTLPPLRRAPPRGIIPPLSLACRLRCGSAPRSARNRVDDMIDAGEDSSDGDDDFDISP